MSSLALVVVAALCSAPGAAQPTREGVEAALDAQLAELTIEPTPIAAALEQLGQRTGLQFVLDADVVALMPSGAATRIRIDIRNLSVRAALTQVFDGLGLRAELVGDKLVVRAGPLLERLGRPLAAAEADLIQRLARAPWAEAQQAAPIPIEFRIPPEQRPRERFEQALAQLAARPAVEQFDATCEMLGWSWRPQDASVVFELRRDELRRRLERRVDLRYQRTALDQLLMDLGQRVGVTVEFESGALQQVAARERAVDLIQRNVSVRQTFERICGTTGLRYDLTESGVRFAGPAPSAAGAPSVPPAGGDLAQWVWMEMELRPGLKFLVPIRAEQLPAAVREECERKLREMLSRMP